MECWERSLILSYPPSNSFSPLRPWEVKWRTNFNMLRMNRLYISLILNCILQCTLHQRKILTGFILWFADQWTMKYLTQWETWNFNAGAKDFLSNRSLICLGEEFFLWGGGLSINSFLKYSKFTAGFIINVFLKLLAKDYITNFELKEILKTDTTVKLHAEHLIAE